MVRNVGFLSKPKTAEEDLADELIQCNKKILTNFLGNAGTKNLQSTLITIGKESTLEDMRNYMDYTLNRIIYVENKGNEYRLEAKLADKVYKSYITDGVSRIDKVNGRFMASQNIKLDMLIEQNNIVIALLEDIRDSLR